MAMIPNIITTSRVLFYIINHHGMAMEAPGNTRRMVCCNAQYSNALYSEVPQS